MRKIVLLCLLATALVFGLTANAFAVLYTCQVNGVGVEQDPQIPANYNLYVYLTDDTNATFTRQKVLLGPISNADAGRYFATALEAIGSQYNVYANLNTTSWVIATDLAYPYAGLQVINNEFTP